jgi:hypothetical protein
MNASETTDPGTRSGATDAPSDEPSRSPDGTPSVAKLIEKLTSRRDFKAHFRQYSLENGMGEPMLKVSLSLLEFDWILRELHRINEVDAASSGEAGTPNT